MYYQTRSALMIFAGALLACGLAAAEGHHEPIFGTIDRIQAGEYSIKGDHGKNMSVRITEDTNVICTTGKDSDFSSSREAVKQIPPTTESGQPADNPGKGLEFISKSKEGCTFQTGDYVKIVGVEAGKAQTIQKLARDKADSQ